MAQIPIHYINLDRAADRRAFMEAQARRLGLGLQRHRATEAGDIADREHAALAGRWERPLTRVELAVFLSHRALWQSIAEAGEPGIILEDDAVFSRRIGTFLGLLQGRLAGLADFDLINLETVGRRKFLRPPAIPLGEGLSLMPLDREKSGAGAYLLTPAGARRLLAGALQGAAPVDAYMFSVARLRIAQLMPPLVMQVHLLRQRGIDPGLVTRTSIHQPRATLPLRPSTLRFHLRRLRTQLRLLGSHCRRLGRTRYRLVDIREEDFSGCGVSRQEVGRQAGEGTP